MQYLLRKLLAQRSAVGRTVRLISYTAAVREKKDGGDSEKPEVLESNVSPFSSHGFSPVSRNKGRWLKEPPEPGIFTVYTPKVGGLDDKHLTKAEGPITRVVSFQLEKLIKLVETDQVDGQTVEEFDKWFPDYHHYQNDEGDSVLHAVAKTGNDECLRMLMPDPGVNRSSYHNYGDRQFVNLLLKPNDYGATPIYLMAVNGHRTLLATLYNHFLPYFRQDLTPSQLVSNRDGTVLMLLRKALAKPTHYGMTPLLGAINAGHTYTAMYLLSHFGLTALQLTYKHSDDGIQQLADSPLSAALRNRNYRLVEYLLQHYETQLNNVGDDDRAELAQHLLDIYLYGSGIKPDVDGHLKEFDRLNVLHLAASMDNGDIFSSLLDKLSKTELPPALVSTSSTQYKKAIALSEVFLQGRSWLYDYSGTPVHFAAATGSLSVVQQLVNKLSELGTLPACWIDHDKGGVSLSGNNITFDQYFNAPTTGGRTPLDIAYRTLRLVNRRHDSLGKVGKGLQQILDESASRYRKVYEVLKRVYMDYPVEKKNKIRDAVIKRLDDPQEEDCDIELPPEDLPDWQLLRHLDERLFVGDQSDQFNGRFNGVYGANKDLIWLLKAKYTARTVNQEAFEYTLSEMKPANYHLADIYGFTALHWAAYIGCVKWTNLLVHKSFASTADDQGVSPDIKLSRDQLNPDERFSGSTPLFEAAYYSHPPVIDALIGYGADFQNPREITGSYPLLILVLTRNIELAIGVIEQQGDRLDLNKENQLGRGLIYMAVSLLVDDEGPYGMRAYSQDLESTTKSYLEKGKLELVRKLEENDRQFKDSVIRLLRLLIAKGANPYVTSYPLRGLPQLPPPFHSRDDRLSARAKEPPLSGEAPLHLAARIGIDYDHRGRALPFDEQTSVKVGTLLLEARYTAPKHNDDTVSLLDGERAYNDPSRLNAEGFSAMHIAAMCGNLAFLQLLINKQVPVDVRSLDGRRPADMVSSENREVYNAIRQILTTRHMYPNMYPHTAFYAPSLDQTRVDEDVFSSLRGPYAH